MTTQKMKCPICGKYFEKYVSEIKRRKNKKPDAVFYCSRSCASIAIHEKIKFSPIIKTCLN